MKKDKNTVIQDIKILAKKLNKVPTTVEFHKEYGYSACYYGNYSNFLIEAGFKTNKIPKLDKEKLEETMRNYIKENGKYPPKKIIDSLVSHTTIKRYYGSMRAFKLMFVEEKKEYNFNNDELIKFLQNKIDNGELYSTNFFKNNKNVSLVFVLKRLKCENWEEVLELIDRKEILKQKIEYEKEKIKKEYRELSEKLNLKTGATIQDIKKYLNYKINKLTYLFGGIRGLKSEAGYDDNRARAFINYAKLKQDVEKLYLEKGKLKQKELITELKKRELASIDTVKTAFKVSSIIELYEILDNKKRG